MGRERERWGGREIWGGREGEGEREEKGGREGEIRGEWVGGREFILISFYFILLCELCHCNRNLNLVQMLRIN